MPSLQTLAVLSAATFIALPFGASAATPPKAEDHAAHHPEASASAPTAAIDAPMKAMREMRDKMMNAKTPEERQALMADHMKAMQGGMQTMKSTGGMSGMGSMGSMGGKASAKSMPPDMAQHRQTMEQRMDMMQMMMEMMMQRAPDAAAPAGK